MQEISEPTLLLNQSICKDNIKRMANKARKNGLAFKPHMKTHQSAEIAQWIKDVGVKAITVSSVKMAEYFALHGWSDITIAFPCNLRQIDKIDALASSISLTLLINSISTASALADKLTNQVNAYIELDTGSHRTGLQVSQLAKIKKLISELSSTQKIKWKGFYSHPGHSYASRSKKEILQVQQSVIEQIGYIRTELQPIYGAFEVCIGDTPSCSIGSNFTGIDAISPGNFVFFDLMQHQIGSCKVLDIAVCMACPVVDKYPERNELIIHGGAIHFSKGVLNDKNISHHGRVAITDGDHWKIRDEQSYLKALSQEHGIVKCSDAVFNTYQVGDLISILPVHSCLTANLMNSYKVDNEHVIYQL